MGTMPHAMTYRRVLAQAGLAALAPKRGFSRQRPWGEPAVGLLYLSVLASIIHSKQGVRVTAGALLFVSEKGG